MVLKIKKIKPMFTALITTMDMYTESDAVGAGGIIDTSKTKMGVKEYQKVVAVGDSVRGIKVGDLVCINPSRFGVKQHQAGSLKDGVVTDNPIMKYNFDVVEMNDTQYLLLQDRDIEFIIEEYEEVPEVNTSSLIQPEKKQIIS